MAQRKRFTRVEMARVLMERNQYKERLMELQEAVRWADMIRAASKDSAASGDAKKGRSSIWRFFSSLFSSTDKPDHRVQYNAPSDQVSPALDLARRHRNRSMEFVDSEITSEKIQKQRAKERREQYRQVRAHVRREDGRVQAYGWSLPSAPQPHSVPAPVYCRPLVEKDPGLKIWCAAGINLTGGNTKDGGAMVGASVFYSNPPPQPEQLPPDVSEVDKLERELQLGVDAGEGPEEEGTGAPGARAEFLCVDLCLHPRQQCGDSGGCQQPRGCTRHLPCVCLPPPGHRFYPWYGTLVVGTAIPVTRVCTAQAEGTDEPDGAEEERERFRQWVVVKDPPELVKDGVNAIPRHNPLALSQMEKISSVLPTMWLGAQNGKLYVHSSVAQWFRCIDSVQLPDAILTIVHIRGRVFVSLANGSVAIFHRSSDGQWDLGNYHLLDLGQPNHSIRCMAVVHDKIWCGITNHVHIIDAKTLTVELPTSWRCAVQAGFVAHPRKESQVRLLAWAGDGVWLSLRLDSTLRLFHAHTHQHLQDLDLEPCVTRMLGTGQLGFSFVRITSLLISSSRLWIGTGNGVIISVPLSDSKLALNWQSIWGKPNNVISQFLIISHLECVCPEEEEEGQPGDEATTRVRVYSDCKEAVTPGSYIPHVDITKAQLSFHGHRDAVKFFVAVPGTDSHSGCHGNWLKLWVFPVGTGSNPFRNHSSKSSSKQSPEPCKYMLVMSGGEGYIDFRL
ncbi:SPAG9, partial [Cordylochernes scorpioides]